MDANTIMLITSLAMNALLIVKDFSRRIRVSKCCGGEIDLDPNTPTQKADEKPPDDKKTDEPKPQTETQQI